MIHNIIDFEESEQSNRTAVKRGVNVELDELKHQYDGLDALLCEVANRMHQYLPEWARQFVEGCIFLSQLGFLTMVTTNHETLQPNYQGESLVGDAWQQMFSNQGYFYFKNVMMKQLDEDVGDKYCKILGKCILLMFQVRQNSTHSPDSSL
jgi:DNA mismatch repair protein MSH5